MKKIPEHERGPAAPFEGTFAHGALVFLLAALQAVCPLLFFTDLTRNPYVTQIYLLYAGLWLSLGL